MAEDTIGRKDDAGKLRYSLVPPQAMAEFVAVLNFGADKYGDHNWRHVEPLQDRYYDALCRHVAAFRDGEIHDKESGLHHLAHAMCCLSFMLQHSIEESEGDDIEGEQVVIHQPAGSPR